MSFIIAPATVSDAPELCRVINAAYRAEGGLTGWTHEVELFGYAPRMDEPKLRDIMGSGSSTFYKCVDQRGAVIGSVHLERQGSRMYLGLLSVLPTIQNQGIGKLLLEAGERYAVAQRSNAVRMTVISIRSELIAWYERHGYKRTGETVPFPKAERTRTTPPDLQFIVLEKPLASRASSTSRKTQP